MSNGSPKRPPRGLTLAGSALRCRVRTAKISKLRIEELQMATEKKWEGKCEYCGEVVVFESSVGDLIERDYEEHRKVSPNCLMRAFTSVRAASAA